MACKAVPPLLSFAGGLWLPESQLGLEDSAENSKRKNILPTEIFLGELGVLFAPVGIRDSHPSPGDESHRDVFSQSGTENPMVGAGLFPLSRI
jgi:hypothetical protein